MSAVPELDTDTGPSEPRVQEALEIWFELDETKFEGLNRTPEKTKSSSWVVELGH